MTTSRRAALGALVSLLLGALLVAAPAHAAAPRLVVYGPGTPDHDFGVTIHRAPQAATRLPGAPKDFQRFVAATVHHLRSTTECNSAIVGVTVNRVRTDGYARGSVNECGGYVALWQRVDGRWKQIEGTQDIWTCRVLRRHHVPAAIIRPDARCYDGHQVVAYHHR